MKPPATIANMRRHPPIRSMIETVRTMLGYAAVLAAFAVASPFAPPSWNMHWYAWLAGAAVEALFAAHWYVRARRRFRDAHFVDEPCGLCSAATHETTRP